MKAQRPVKVLKYCRIEPFASEHIDPPVLLQCPMCPLRFGQLPTIASRLPVVVQGWGPQTMVPKLAH